MGNKLGKVKRCLSQFMSFSRGWMILSKSIDETGREQSQVSIIITQESSGTLFWLKSEQEGKSTAEKNWQPGLILRAPAFPTDSRAAGAWHFLKCNQLIHPILGESIFSVLSLVWSLLGKTRWEQTIIIIVFQHFQLTVSCHIWWLFSLNSKL